MSENGFANEERIRIALDGKRFGDANKNMQDFLRFAYAQKTDDSVIITCVREAGQSKSDLLITIGKTRFRTGIKKGHGNSVHQEPVEDFISHISEEFSIDDQLKKDIRFFIWGDGTLDGTGLKSNRMNAHEIRRNYPEKIERIKKFLKENKKELIIRFIIKGPKSKYAPDFIYYGDQNKGLWAKSGDVVEFLCKEENESKGTIPVGALTFQAWNRVVGEEATSEHKRGVIQLKWPSLSEDMEKLMRQRH